VADSVDLSVVLGGLELANPVLAASGTYGFGMEMARVAEVGNLGAVVLKSLTVKPRSGNAPPRIVETPSGMLNAIGLENPGVDYFLKALLPQVRGLGVPLVANIAGETAGEYAELARRISAESGGAIAAIELNVSCPNVSAGGMAFGVAEKPLREVVGAARAETKLPLIVKLSPNVTDIVALARAAMEAGADVLSLVNTLVGMAVDVESRRPVLANVTGGLSGPAIKPVALRMVHQVWLAIKAPIIGMGGITSAEDAMESIIAGATAVAVGTMNFVAPDWSARLPREIAARAAQLGASSLRELVGTLRIT